MTFRVPTLALTAALMLGACADPIVGAECKSGLTACDGRCVQLDSDSAHCGACGNDCAGTTCRAGQCMTMDAGSLEGGSPDGGDAGDAASRSDAAGGSVDASSLDGSVETGPAQGTAGFPLDPDGPYGPDGGVAGCAVGASACGTAGCRFLQSDPEHCGGCDQACQADQFCIDGSCSDACDPPLVRCGNRCVDTRNDPSHCGRCNRRCISGICEDGVCADAVPGHVVVIGHDYRNRNTTMDRLVGNSLFLARGAPVRTLVYEGQARAASVRGVEAAIDVVVAETGRSWMQTAVVAGDLPVQLKDADALLVHAQSGATDEALAELGDDWGAALTQFLFRGGVVVVLDTQSGNNGGTFRLLQPSGLFTALARERIPEQRLHVVDPGIGVAVDLPSSYVGRDTTVRFLAPETDATVVVQDDEAEAVVLHKVIRVP